MLQNVKSAKVINVFLMYINIYDIYIYIYIYLYNFVSLCMQLHY